MIDWLVIWGVTQAAGFVFKPILEDLAKDAAKDYAKDFFKDCLKKVIHLPEKDVLKEAYGKALKEFLQFFQQELDDADFQEAQIKQYIRPLDRFTKQEKVETILGSAFEIDCKSLDTHVLAQTWQEMNLPFLPDEFNWERVGKRYLKKVKAIIQESDKLRPIFAVQTQSQMAENLQELAGIAPDYNLEKYAEGLKEQYGNLKLESLDTTGVYYNELKLWKIFIAQNVRECQEFLPQVYEVPKDHIKRLREAGEAIEILSEEELERQRHRYINQQSQLVWEVIADPTAKPAKSPIQQVVILGDPGAGKSSLLQYIALIWAERPLRDLSLYPIPLLLELRIYARDKQAGKCQDILSFIHGGNITCRLNQQQLHEKLRSGQAVALFDGIDEIFDPVLREEVVTDIHRFSNDYAQVQVIITSRWLGYKAQRLRDAGFRHFMLQDLEIEQIEDFLERWHELTFTDQADKVRKWERLQRAIQDSKSIRELAGNPLLLTMMAILNRNQELPRDRPELYNQASRVLLHQWDVERVLTEDARIDPKTFDYRNKQAMLRKVAYRMQSSEQGLAGNLISESALREEIVLYLQQETDFDKPKEIAVVLIHQLRTRNFILCFLGADSYGFVHRTFLEYFCAWEFVWQFKEDQTLTIEGLINEVFESHWEDESWHEVLRLICGMIEPKFVAEIIDFLLAQEINRSEFLDEFDGVTKEGLSNLILATNCFAEARNRNLIATTSEELLEKLKSEIEHESKPWFNSDLASTLVSLIATNWLDHTSTLPWLKNCLNFSSSSFVPESAVTAIAQGWKENPDTLSWLKDRALQDKNWAVRQAAVTVIAEGWKEDPDTLPLLKDRALQDEWAVRQAAVTVIAQDWKEDPDTLPFLKDRALLDEDNDVRQAAVYAIAEGWKEDPDTLPWLKDRALQDEDNDVRQVAVNAIAQGWKEDPDTLPWFKDRALHYNNLSVLQTAVYVIAQFWKEDPDTLPWLKDCALQDKDEWVRRAAVNAIAQGWKEDPDTLPWLKDRALRDENWDVREAAVTAISQGWKEDPDTLHLLKDRALQDEDYPVRRVAVNAIAEGWNEDPDILPFLKDLALQDEDNDVRQTAVTAIAQFWKEDPKTLPLLKNRALQDENHSVRQAAVNAIIENWQEDPEQFEFLANISLNDPFKRQHDFQYNPRQNALKVLLKNFSHYPKTLEILNQVALNDSDEKLREFAVEKLRERETG
jgi:HEAT repeat protein